MLREERDAVKKLFLGDEDGDIFFFYRPNGRHVHNRRGCAAALYHPSPAYPQVRYPNV